MKKLTFLLVVLSLAISGCSHLGLPLFGTAEAPEYVADAPEAREVPAVEVQTSQSLTLERQPLRAELDRDHDGVVDSVDECLHTPPDVAVDAFGCPVPLYLRTNLTFQPNETAASDRLMQKLDRIGRLLQQNPDTTVTVEGHTDDAGDAATNMTLSNQRAQSIKLLLTQHYGIEPSRIMASGYGETRPLVSNATEEGRSRNRRVEVALNGYYRSETSYIALHRPYNIHFETGQSMISGKFKDKVDDLAEFMLQNPDTQAVIDGHTDNVGDPGANLVLSQQRAEAVKQYLQEKYGIAPERLTAAGHGERAPIASNDTSSGRFKNRRVTITVNRSSLETQQASRFSSRLATNGRIDTATYAPLEEKVTLRFRADNEELDSRSARQIDEIGLMLQKQPRLRVTIEGHARSGNDSSENMQLSRQRAEMVKRYLQVRYDISPDRLRAIGYGADLPVADASEMVQISVDRF